MSIAHIPGHLAYDLQGFEHFAHSYGRRPYLTAGPELVATLRTLESRLNA